MRFLIFALVILSYSFTIAQDVDKAKLDLLFDAIASNERGMGSLSIFQDGKEVYQRSVGFEDIENETLATGKTRYRVGSITKTFTATIIMELIEDGQLTLEAKLSTFFPQFENAEKITIEHLLQHRSGLFNFTNDTLYLSYREEAKTKKELLTILAGYENTFNPGEKMEYSNTGYVLLGFIIEELDQKSLAQSYQDRIISPLSLKNTYYGGKIGAQPNEAFSYKLGEGWEKTSETDMSIPGGAGAIVSTPTDINKFYYGLFHEKLVGPESISQMTTLKDNYGFGLFNFPFDDKIATGHNGGIDGFGSSAGHFTDDDMTITYISNGSDWPTNNIMIGALSIYFGQVYAIPELEKIVIADGVLNSYLGTYSSPTFPLKITIAKAGTSITAQATGQGAFPLEAKGDHKFVFDQAGITMLFDTKEGNMTFTQGPGTYVLTKE